MHLVVMRFVLFRILTIINNIEIITDNDCPPSQFCNRLMAEKLNLRRLQYFNPNSWMCSTPHEFKI